MQQSNEIVSVGATSLGQQGFVGEAVSQRSRGPGSGEEAGPMLSWADEVEREEAMQWRLQVEEVTPDKRSLLQEREERQKRARELGLPSVATSPRSTVGGGPPRSPSPAPLVMTRSAIKARSVGWPGGGCAVTGANGRWTTWSPP
ncbi:unnamed protein product, partial [Trichogramma brassicae]